MTVRNNFDNFYTSASFTTIGVQNESKAFERSHQTNSTNDLFSPSLSKKKQISNYRRSPAQKIDLNLDYVEENTYLESDPTVEIAFDDDENVVGIPKSW
ncbi:hypothetical protein LOAG_16565 [Loa loa]|uniref:Uncharacterized protein n=1 Tax=Loa loa TaxID=7209 RepID=A0A1S0ULQ4_LOALO|nr:hypothetical protein LOAG_16565 [Loa loa]EJD76493.1 hypothetical protein LOAG_16565 [Loa loa]